MSEVKPWKNRKTQEEIRQIMNNNSPQHPKNVQVDLTHTNKDPKLDVQTTNSDREDQLNMLWDCFHPYDKEKTYAKWLELINTSIQEAKVEALKIPNDLLRSCFQVACREYALNEEENTEWSPLIIRLKEELEREHEIIFPPNKGETIR